MVENLNGKKKVYCNRCLGICNHTVLYQKNDTYEQEDEWGGYSYGETSIFLTVQCDGCEYISFAEDYSNSNGDSLLTQYPPQTYRKEPEWLSDLLLQGLLDNPYKYDLIKEIYIALRNDQLRLAVMGIRALLEQVMIEKIGDHGTFKRNIDKFQEEGFISRVQREAVEPVIETGHAAIHRGFKPSKVDVVKLMDITESIIESIFINIGKAESLKYPRKSPLKTNQN